MTLRIGFTGTQVGMTEYQKRQFSFVVSHLDDIEFHHGDCIGADSDAHTIVKDLCVGLPKVVIHPPRITTKRAYCPTDDWDVTLPAKEYLERNRDIVDSCQFLIATPKTEHEELRSGTWSTVRYARRTGRLVLIIPPEGR